MAELATLGIAVESNGVDQGTRKLDNLSAAAQRAQAATGALSGAARSANAAVAGAAAGSDLHATALRAEAAAATQATTAIRAHGVAANQNSRGMGAAAANAANLSAQFNDVAVTAAAGASAMQIGLQQGLQMAQVLGPLGAAGAVKSLGQAFLLVLSPVNLMVIAATALVAAGIQMVNWSKLAASVLNLLADNLEVIAPYAAAAAAGLALLYAPAMISGVVQMIALMARLSVAALGAAAAMAAANPAVALIAGFAVAVVAANVFRDELTEIFGVDIVGAAKDGLNIIIGGFVGAYNGVVAAWDTLPDALADIGIQAGNRLLTGIQVALRNMIIEINSALRSASKQLEGTFLAFDAPQINTKATLGSLGSWEVDNPNAGAARKVGRIMQDEMSAAHGPDYAGDMIAEIERGASSAADKLKKLAAGLLEVDDKKKKKRGKSDEDKYSDLISGAEKRVTSLRAELEAVDLNTEASARLRFEQDLLAQAQQKGLKLLPEQRDRIRELATEYGALAAAMERAQLHSDLKFEAAQLNRSPVAAKIAERLRGTSMGMDSAEANFMRQLQNVEDLRDSANGFFTAIKEGVLSGDDIGRSIMRKIANSMMDEASKLLDNVIQTLVRSLVPAPSASFGGLAGGQPGVAATGMASNAVSLASGLLGSSEKGNRADINSYLKAGGVDLDAAQQAWCAAFVNSSLEQVGIEGSGSNVATSFAKWGSSVNAQNVMRGDVLLQSNGRGVGQTGGHVGLATGLTRMQGDNLQLQMLSGNVGNKVGTDWRNASDLIVRRSEAAGQALDKLGSTSLDATQGLGQFGNSLANAFPAAPSAPSGGLGGIFGRLFGGGGATMASMNAISPLAASHIAAGGVGLFAEGGVSDRPAIFGEAGPEAAVPLSRGRRIPVELRGRGTGSSMTYAPTTHISVGANAGVTKADVEAIVQDNNKRQAEAFEKKQANSWRWN